MGPLGALAAAALAALPAASSATVRAPEAVLAAVGDIRLDGPVGALIERRGPGYPTEEVREALAADIVFGNLEGSLTDRGTKLPKIWNFRAPPSRASALSAAGFTVLSLANNHVFDYGAVGLSDTLRAVRERGLAAVGAGKDRAEAEALRVVEVRGLKVGFLAFTSAFPREAWAGPGRPGVAYADLRRLPGLVASARERCDVVVVSFHGGTELAEEPNEVQLAFSRAAAEAGADLVLGHHPHVLQPLEVVAGRPILHSLGNFLFVSPTPSTRDGVVARATLSKGGVVRIDFVALDGNWGRPRPASDEGRARVLAALDRRGALSGDPERFRLSP